jgi:Fe-Mn family superoxide dismutase
MKPYTARTFSIPSLTGISEKQIDVHLALYQGYVKNLNTLNEQIADLEKMDAVKYAFTLETLRRRAGWEFNGMRNHEFYFAQFEKDAQAYENAATLRAELSKEYATFDDFTAHFKKICLSRGPGWALLVQDRYTRDIFTTWVTEHEQGMLADCQILLAADMWEHAFMVDYVPAEKAKAVDAFMANVHWGVVESRLLSA